MKQIDHANWLLADTGGKEQGTDARLWREAFLVIRLAATVPPEVARMFEAARGGMLYGYFFQPLLAMGLEQCYRTLERGARLRCNQAGLAVTCADSSGKEHPLSFGHNLRALAKQDLISDEDQLLWQQARELREWVVAPEHQALLTRDHAATALARAAELLEHLFHP